jgi:N-acyl-D-aspartate/D-glutamate deacylase
MSASVRPPLDLVIRNGEIADGSGARLYAADLGVRDGKLVAIGRIEGAAAREVDARGRVVAPGFIDIHTHYDAQLCWDGLATPSPLHGVTSVLTGNCSLSLAPVKGDGPERVVGMFQTIEDIGAPTFAAGVPFTWQSFAEYLDFLRPKLSVNLAALVGHSTLRYFALGAAAQQRAASDAEIAHMCELLAEAVRAGARGFSMSALDVDETLRPVPSRYADLRERIELAKASVSAGGQILETVPPATGDENFRAFLAELGQISRESGIVATFQPVLRFPAAPERWKQTLDWIAEENAQGARVYGQTTPRSFDTTLRLEEQFFTLLLLPSWAEIMRRPAAERLPLFADRSRRAQLVAESQTYLAGMLETAWIGETFAPEHREYRGRKLSEIARERGENPIEALLEISVRDELRTEFKLIGMLQDDPDVTAQILADPNILVGASDAGAHVSQICGAGDTTALFATFVRERGDLSLPHAVWRLTGQLADLFGLRGVGHIEVGAPADLVIFDPATIAPGRESYVRDVPGNARRYLRDAVGVDSVWVAGASIAEGGRYVDSRRGRVL